MPDELDPTLLANLRALDARAPGLVERLCAPCDGRHVQAGPDGPELWRRGHAAEPLRWPEAELRLAVDGLGGHGARPGTAGRPTVQGELLLLGVGTGEALPALLRAHPSLRVVAYERDPFLLRLALTGADLSDALRAGRLELRLGADLLPALRARRFEHHLVHPLLGEVYGLERDLVRRARGAGLGDARALALATGPLFVSDLARCARDEGLLPFPLELERWSREELAHALRTLDPVGALAINLVHGFPELCREAGVPLGVWEIDPSLDRAPSLAGDGAGTSIFTWRARNVAAFLAAGFPRVEALPLAAHPGVRRPLPGADLADVEAPVVFVGASLVDPARRLRRRFVERLLALEAPDGEADPNSDAARREALVARVEAVLAEQRRTPCRYRLPELARAAFGPALDAAARATREDPLAWLAESAACETRLTVLASLASHGVDVWGDGGWRVLERHGVRYRGPAAHGEPLTRIYNGSGIHLDVGRLYQPDIVTMRVFDVLACGGFVLTQHSDELAALLTPGEEVATWRDLPDLRAQVARWLADPAGRRRLAERGRAAVLARHDLRARVRHMLVRMGVARAAHAAHDLEAPAAPLPGAVRSGARSQEARGEDAPGQGASRAAGDQSASR